LRSAVLFTAIGGKPPGGKFDSTPEIHNAGVKKFRLIVFFSKAWWRQHRR